MAGSRSTRLVQTALRCYPERWRSRHGEDAAELARLLIRDGRPARSIAWSYFKGAASTRLVQQPRRSIGAAVGVVLAVACSLALLSSSAPASAAGKARGRITNRSELLHCSAVPGGSVSQALPVLERRHVRIVWDTAASRHGEHC